MAFDQCTDACYPTATLVPVADTPLGAACLTHRVEPSKFL
jgi:hypothetical protein